MSRRKTALSRALVTLSTIVVSLVLLLPTTGQAGDNLESGAAYTVRPGDTLWEIAGSLSSEGEDVRDIVASINELNGLVTSIILPGQQLDLPELGRG